MNVLNFMSFSMYFHIIHIILKYLMLLFQNDTPFSDLEKQLHSYNDLIQIPLQPLMDNLPSATYDVFERDAVKYSLVRFFQTIHFR